MHDALSFVTYPRLDDDELYTWARVLQDAAGICGVSPNADALLYFGKEFAGKAGARRLGETVTKPAPQQGE